MARKPQPDQLKIAKGETRPSRLSGNVIQFPTIEEYPNPPEWMNIDGKALWEEIVPMLMRQKILSKADLPALSHLCQLHGEMLKLYRAGMQPTAAFIGRINALFAEFGMTSSSRSRISKLSSEGNNPFSKNGKRQRETENEK